MPTRLACLVPVLALAATSAHAADLALSIEGLRNASGNVSICLFQASTGFPDCGRSASALKRTVPAASAAGPILFRGLKAGSYAVTVLHDENADGKLDTNLLSIPKEGVGVSNNRMPRFSAPTYEDARFDMPEGRAQRVRLVYR